MGAATRSRDGTFAPRSSIGHFRCRAPRISPSRRRRSSIDDSSITSEGHHHHRRRHHRRRHHRRHHRHGLFILRLVFILCRHRRTRSTWMTTVFTMTAQNTPTAMMMMEEEEVHIHRRRPIRRRIRLRATAARHHRHHHLPRPSSRRPEAKHPLPPRSCVRKI